MRESFIVHNSTREIIEALDGEQVKELMLALIAHNEGEEVQPFEDLVVKMAFIPLRQQMDRENEKYEETCKRRAEAGRKGGAARRTAEPEETEEELQDVTGEGEETPETCETSEEVLEETEESKQSLAKEAIASKTKQRLAKKAKASDTDTDTESDTDTDIYNNTLSCISESPKSREPTLKDVVNLYTELCPSLPTVRTLSESRKRTVRARLKKYSLDDFREVFAKAEKSDFLCGRSGKWRASFDWLINDTNMAKVLDGNYDNRANILPIEGRSAPQNTRFNNFSQRKYDYAALERQLVCRG